MAFPSIHVSNRGFHAYGNPFLSSTVKKYDIQMFEKFFENITYFVQVTEQFPPDTLSREEKINLVAAALRKWGTKYLDDVYAREYWLTMQEQKEAKRLAGDGLKENIATWEDKIPNDLLPLREKAEAVLKEYNVRFMSYLNRVGDWKPVVTVKIEGEIFVVRQVNGDYIRRYDLQKEREHRPDYRTFPIEEDSFLFLSKFMGSQTIDFSDERHLEMIIDLALNFPDERETSTIDFNPGNLIIQGNKLYYIDKDLDHAPRANRRLHNLQVLFYRLDSFFCVEHEKVQYKNCVKSKIKPLLNPENAQDQEILRAFF